MFNSEDGIQAYLIFQPLYRYFKTIANTNYILSWESKGLSAESIKPSTTSDNSIYPKFSHYDYNIRLKFTGSCLKQPLKNPTLKIFLFGAVALTKNADIDKYGYSGYGTGFDRRGSFSFPGVGYGQNVLTFGVDMISSRHIDNKEKTY